MPTARQANVKAELIGPRLDGFGGLTFEGVEGPIPGKQLVFFRRQPDGTWLIAAVHGSSNLPPPGN